MTAFRTSGQTYFARVYDRSGAAHVRSLGTRDAEEADAFEGMLKRFRRQRRWDVLALLIDRAAEVPDVYDADVAGTLAQLVADTHARLAASALTVADPALSPLVTEWTPLARSHRYPPHLVRFVAWLGAEGLPATVSSLTRKHVSRFLATLTNSRNEDAADGPTRNRYRASLMQFAKWLVERELIETNPVRDVAGYAENEPRMVHYTRESAMALVGALTDPKQRALEALMAGTGCEWGAATKVRGRDVRHEKREVYADGPKNAQGRGTKWRKRWVRFTEPWAWTLFAAYARDFMGNARLFADLTDKDAVAAHHEACESVGLERSTLHDWRHTYAILSLDDGIKPQTVRRQLGHSPHSTVLERVYAAHIPTTDADYEKRRSATKAVTRRSGTA